MLSKPVAQPKPKADPKKRTRTHAASMAILRDTVWRRDANEHGIGYCYVCTRTIFREVSDWCNGEVHHCQSRGAHPEKRYDPENAVLLCGNCHRSATEHRIEVKR